MNVLRRSSSPACRFYFVFCEAAFDARYIHNYHMLFIKAGGRGAEDAHAPEALPQAQTDVVPRVAAANGHAENGHAENGVAVPSYSASSAIIRELPSDSVTQVGSGRMLRDPLIH